MDTRLWADVTLMKGGATDVALAHIRTSDASGVLVRPDQLDGWEPLARIAVASLVTAEEAGRLDDDRVQTLIAASPQELDGVRAAAGNRAVGVRCEITDGDTMNEAASLCGTADFLVAAFADETNIPLELLLARAQGTRTQVYKQLLTSAETASVAGVLETGPAGLVVGAGHLADLDKVAAVLRAERHAQLDLVPLEVVRSEPVGMGYRGCIDTTHLFDDDEGMVIGSTSSGGIFVCAEVHYLPYMNLRPFRVNAGAVHSYVFGTGTTAYITDLAAGEKCYAVNTDGRFREAMVGRIKVELRPLRLVEARYGDVTVNAFLQDDWHVRVMSAEGKPLNLTEVVPGTLLLGRVTEPGRHVGIKVDEEISEF